jgi:nuclear transport factor 2 (NTF2) superfamily protein
MTDSLPSFTLGTAIAKARMVEDGRKTGDLERGSEFYTEDSAWRNRGEFIHGRLEIGPSLRVTGIATWNIARSRNVGRSNEAAARYARRVSGMRTAASGIATVATRIWNWMAPG